MFFAKNAECLIVKSISLFGILLFTIISKMLDVAHILYFWFFLDFHAIIRPSCAFYVKRNGAPRRLALHTGTIFFETNNAVKCKSFLIYLIQSDGALRFDSETRNPCCTAQMNPFVLGWNETNVL